MDVHRWRNKLHVFSSFIANCDFTFVFRQVFPHYKSDIPLSSGRSWASNRYIPVEIDRSAVSNMQQYIQMYLPIAASSSNIDQSEFGVTFARARMKCRYPIMSWILKFEFFDEIFFLTCMRMKIHAHTYASSNEVCAYTRTRIWSVAVRGYICTDWRNQKNFRPIKSLRQSELFFSFRNSDPFFKIMFPFSFFFERQTETKQFGVYMCVAPAASEDQNVPSSKAVRIQGWFCLLDHIQCPSLT